MAAKSEPDLVLPSVCLDQQLSRMCLILLQRFDSTTSLKSASEMSPGRLFWKCLAGGKIDPKRVCYVRTPVQLVILSAKHFKQNAQRQEACTHQQFLLPEALCPEDLPATQTGADEGRQAKKSRQCMARSDGRFEVTWISCCLACSLRRVPIHANYVRTKGDQLD